MYDEEYAPAECVLIQDGKNIFEIEAETIELAICFALLESVGIKTPEFQYN